MGPLEPQLTAQAGSGGPPIYDLKNLKCPLPVLKTGRRLESLRAGERLWVETTDPMAVVDLPHFCNERGHRLLATETMAEGHRFLIEKGD